jgi:hypothetical protein
MAARRRTSDPTILYAFATAVCLVAAIAGFVMQRENRARLAAYRHDAHCRTALSAADTAGRRAWCTVSRTTVLGRWTRSRRHGTDYLLALSGTNDRVDSVELAIRRDRATWNEAIPGSTAYVERFTDPAPGAVPRITALRLRDTSEATSWNPEYRAEGGMMVSVFFGLFAPFLAVASLRSRKRSRNRAATVAIRQTYHVTFEIR